MIKLVNQIGKFVTVDDVIAKRDKLQYARILIEVKVDEEFPDPLSFIIEKGLEVIIDVSYKWKPVMCTICKKMEQTTKLCKKTVQRQKQSAKQVTPQPAKEKVAKAIEKQPEFQMVRHAAKRNEKTLYVEIKLHVSYWYQRMKEDWIKLEDASNNRFFSRYKQIQMKKEIIRLEALDGTHVTYQSEITQVVQQPSEWI